MINNLPVAFEGGSAHVTIYNLDGSVAYEHESPVSAPAATAVGLGPVQFPERLSAVHFIKADLKDSSGKMVSTQFLLARGAGAPGRSDGPEQAARGDAGSADRTQGCGWQEPGDGDAEERVFEYRADDARAVAAQEVGERVLPVFYDGNYISLVAGRTADHHDGGRRKRTEWRRRAGGGGWMEHDGGAEFVEGRGDCAQCGCGPDHSPETGLPFQTEGLR